MTLNKFKKFCVQESCSIDLALKAFSKIDKKTLLVINNNNKFLGILTDGDLRRFLIKEKNLKKTIRNIYNKKPVFFYESNYTESKIKNIIFKNRFDFVPIVTKIKKKILNVYFWEDFFSNSQNQFDDKLKIPLVIMAGGKGTRLAPFTKILPKPLIPFKNKTLLEHVIDKFNEFNIKNFYISLNYKSALIKSYFKEIKNKRYKISFINERKPLGTIGSLGFLKQKLKRTFFVANSDTLINFNLFEFYKFHKENNFDITLVVSEKKYEIPYGNCVTNRNFEIKKIAEKPSFDLLINVGIYLMEPKILKYIHKAQYLDANELFNNLIKQKLKIGAYPISNDDWKDLGQWVEFKNELEKI